LTASEFREVIREEKPGRSYEDVPGAIGLKVHF
jgi:hypothetical protein